MLRLLGEGDDRDTVCASSQDSCSTIALYPQIEAEEADEGVEMGPAGACVPPRSTPPPAVLLTECNVRSSNAVEPFRVEPSPIRAAEGDEGDVDVVTLELRWHVRLPTAGALKHLESRLASSLMVMGETGDSATGHDGSTHRDHRSGSRTVSTPPLYVSYRVPPPHKAQEAGNGSDRLALVLSVGRSLFLKSLTAVDDRQSGSAREGWWGDVRELVPPSISRHHATAIFFYRYVSLSSSGSLTVRGGDSGSALQQQQQQQQQQHHQHLDGGLLDHEPTLVFQSMDVTDFASCTSVNGVPLSRHHRYHFTKDAAHPVVAPPPPPASRTGRWSCARRMLSLGVGPHVTLDVCQVRDSHGGGGAVAGVIGQEMEMEEEAILVHSRSDPSSSSAGVSLLFAPAGHSVAQSNTRARRQTAVLPSSAETIVSSTTAGTGANGLGREGDDPLRADRPPAKAGGGDGDGGSPRQHPRVPLLQRRERDTAASVDAEHGTSKQAALPVGSTNAPSFLGPSRTASQWPAPTTTDGEGDSTPLSTPSSMRNSTWTETFVDTLRDSPPEPVAAPTRTTVRETPSSARAVKSVARAPAPRRGGGKRVLYTTGLRLEAAEERSLAGLGFSVNPDLRKAAAAAELLVVQRPLIRSVKLLTVLPYVDAVVQRQWLDRVLQQGSEHVAPSDFPYEERRTATSIEGANDFSLAATLRVPPAVRQQLFASHTFWVHPSAKPQEPPANDLKTVITASGGSLTKQASQATVLVLGGKRMSRAALRGLAKEVGCGVDDLLAATPPVLLVHPDHLFRAVLQQKPLEHSCAVVEVGTTQDASGASQRRASGRRSVPVSTVSVKPTAAASPSKTPRRRGTAGPTKGQRSSRGAATHRPVQEGHAKGTSATSSPVRKSARK